MSSSDQAFVIVEREGPRVELILNRPKKRNALIGPLVQQLKTALDTAVADESCHVILIRGAGGAFCAGLDLGEFAADPAPPWRADFQKDWAAYHIAAFNCPKPIVGALERFAIAGGSGLAMSCDFLIAGDGAFLHVSEVERGMMAPMNVAWLTIRFGAARAMELTLGAERTYGPDLVRMGLAVRSVPDDEVLASARAFADKLAGHNAASMAKAKKAIRHTAGFKDFGDLVRELQNI